MKTLKVELSEALNDMVTAQSKINNILLRDDIIWPELEYKMNGILHTEVLLDGTVISVYYYHIPAQRGSRNTEGISEKAEVDNMLIGEVNVTELLENRIDEIEHLILEKINEREDY